MLQTQQKLRIMQSLLLAVHKKNICITEAIPPRLYIPLHRQVRAHELSDIHLFLSSILNLIQYALSL